MKSKRKIRHLGDNDVMPFGKYEGIEMVNLPPSYVAWLLKQKWIKDWPPVHGYLLKHREEFARALSIEDVWKRSGWWSRLYPN